MCGQKPKENLVIFAETCAEWMMFALASFKCGFPGKVVSKAGFASQKRTSLLEHFLKQPVRMKFENALSD